MRLILSALILAKLVLVGAFSFLYLSDTSHASLEAFTPTPTPSDAIARPVSEPYTGPLDIFEDADREKNLQINRVMDLLAVSEGKAVADIGAGSGWFTVRAARRVGEKGKVFAVEINQEYAKFVTDRAKKEKLPQVEAIIGKVDDPLLAKSSVDAVLILKTYHEFGEPVKIMRKIRDALKKGGRVGIIDRDGEGDDHGIAGKTVIEEMERAGFKLREKHDFVKTDKMDYFMIFESK